MPLFMSKLDDFWNSLMLGTKIEIVNSKDRHFFGEITEINKIRVIADQIVFERPDDNHYEIKGEKLIDIIFNESIEIL